MRDLQSYLEGEWKSGTGDVFQVYNPTTEEVCGEGSTGGLDLNQAFQYGRRVGGEALRAMTFAERAAVLKVMSDVIFNSRDELIGLSRENGGTTRSDAKFDIDGAAGTLAYYAAIGKRLGDQAVLLDGRQEPILRSKRFIAQHISVPKQGIAVHINAFNFPAWGMGEKAAVALLAGMPVFVKPATATALLAQKIVQLWVDSGALPEGAVSFLAGPAGNLLDGLGPQDVVAFTGSADTGRIIRSHSQVLAQQVPVNVEADSLNSSILGPDIEPDSDTFWMFISDVMRDLTQKAGQKCTAVRRIFVPKDLFEATSEVLRDRMGQLVVGDPSEKGTNIAPLASASQQRDIAKGIAQLEKVTESLWDGVAVPEVGYFVSPRLFVSHQGADTPFVHEHEVFGPVATVLTYSGDPDEVVDWVSLGRGGLVASLYSNDLDWSRKVLLGLAPWHGRLHWGSRKVHDQSPGPGTVLPNLIHGGPGKAGSGEELGGLRGLGFYMQRTAIQGDRALLERLFGSPSSDGDG
jgi:3,4-dehydroadipyl-CoA semialdehyde dehydrogenase